MKRKIINIQADKCTGCGLCIPNCPEGAIQLIDGKARLISDLFCDGLGACLGHCPEGAIIIEERDAEPYDERKVMANVVTQGPNVILAHLEHLKHHGQDDFLRTAEAYLDEKKIPNPMRQKASTTTLSAHGHAGCPGARAMSFQKPATTPQKDDSGERRPSQLTHWPVQLHLISPMAPHYQKADVLLAADCTAFSAGEFHRDFLKNKALIIACPKLDDGQEVYLEKIQALIDNAQINTLTVLIMEVPCCSGLLRLAQQALAQATRKIPLKCIVLSLQGDVLREDWV